MPPFALFRTSMKKLESFIPSFIDLQLLLLGVVYSEFKIQPNRKLSFGGCQTP